MSQPNQNPLSVQFFIPETPLSTDLDGKATKEQGRPIYKTNEYVRIYAPGNPKNVVVCLAHEPRISPKTAMREYGVADNGSGKMYSYAELFPDHYRQFKAGIEEQISGTPLSELTALSAAKRAELKALGIKTIEALASLEGVSLKRLGLEGTSLKNMGAAYLARATGQASDNLLAAENAALKARVDDLASQMEMLKSGKPPAVEPTEAEPNVNPPPESDFEGWADDDLKFFIKERTGQGVRGQPSHATLVRMCEEALAKELEAA